MIPWFTALFQKGETENNEFFVVLFFCNIFSCVSSDENKPIWMHAEEREECKVRPLP